MSETFKRVLGAVDDSAAGAVAARVAARTARPEGSLTLVSVDETALAVHGGFMAPVLATQLEEHGEAALHRGRAAADAIHGLWTRRLEGDPVECLLAEIDERETTLLVVGSHGYRRATGILFGLVGSTILHEAPCSVLVAREERPDEPWPHSIVVGVDGSPESAAAAAAARELATRFGAQLRFVAATGDHVDLAAARAIAPALEVRDAGAVDELRGLSELADLVVVGSRGLKGLRALGSVSERIAHEAECSVLVVRSERHRP
jgi:nucleotide-binding universal stress UspA family protein